MAPLIPFVPLIAAGIGVGATVYTQGKAEDAAEAKAAADAQSRNEKMGLDEQKTREARERAQSQSRQKEAGNALAFESQMNAMDRSAAAEKRAQDEARLLAENDPAEEYAAKFRPGTGETNSDSAMDFLVPKIAEGTGLVADTTPGASTGLQTPLGFSV